MLSVFFSVIAHTNGVFCHDNTCYLYFFRDSTCYLSFYHFHPLTNIQTFICNFACKMTITYFLNRTTCIYQAATRWDLPPYRIIIWLIDDVTLVYVCLSDDLILAFLLQQSETGNRWIRAHIDYHPCITSEPSNQVC